MELRVDGESVTIGADATILDACDAAGRYVPRLCHYPGFACCATRCVGADATAGSGAEDVAESVAGRELGPWTECGLCAVRLADGSEALACATTAAPGMVITTDDPALRAARLERLAPIIARHPHSCLSCPDRDGCSRDECTYGIPPQARCCAELGRCELGKVVAFVDAGLVLPRRPVTVSRDAVTEGRIRREMGLCVGCGRCVRVCESAPEAGRALEMTIGADVNGVTAAAARPKKDSLRASGCTFCGQCVLVCPAGALTAPGVTGARWLEGRRERSRLATSVLPPERRRPFTRDAVATAPDEAGVLQLLDRAGQVLRISGVADLRLALTEALADPASAETAFFQVDLDPLYTQRESELLARYAQEKGHLPPGNVVDDDLFADDPA